MKAPEANQFYVMGADGILHQVRAMPVAATAQPNVPPAMTPPPRAIVNKCCYVYYINNLLDP
jgi:hypothetical protein